MLASDAQVRKLMEEVSKHGKIGLASLRAGLDRKTGSKYVKLGKLPSEMMKPRHWRTRKDPFEEDWPLVEAKLEEAPTLEAKTLFEWLCGLEAKYQEGQLRTLQRRVREWRALHGPDKVVFFPQEHRPGEAMQSDFTSGNELGITIEGEAFAHQIFHSVLPYSNWEWITVCRSESYFGLRKGTQASVFMLGRIPEYHQTDNTTAATHKTEKGRREFNDNYQRFISHLGMKPRTIAVGEKQQNGDVESSHGAFKRAVEQYLLLRGSRDFESVREYEEFLREIARKRNELRAKRVAEELAVMRKLEVQRLPEYDQEDAHVTSWSTIRVKRNTYSVPSRLIGEKLKVRVSDEQVEVYYKGVHQMTVPRLLGEGSANVNYRHIIWSLVRKPGAFQRYKYRDAMFPSLVFRKAYDALCDSITSVREADIHYLRILHLAASTMETEVETALELLDEQQIVPTIEEVKSLVTPREPEIPDLKLPEPALEEYNVLLQGLAEMAQ